MVSPTVADVMTANPDTSFKAAELLAQHLDQHAARGRGAR